MGFAQDILKRATIRGVTKYLLYGSEPDQETRDYETRLDETYLKYEKKALEFTENKPSELIDLANEAITETVSVYSELGLQAGILLMQDMLKNVEQKSGGMGADYRAMYDSLSSQVTQALLILRDTEDDAAEKALEVLKSAQSVTEELRTDTENPAKKEV